MGFLSRPGCSVPGTPTGVSFATRCGNFQAPGPNRRRPGFRCRAGVSAALLLQVTVLLVTAAVAAADSAAPKHRIATGETLYSIARKYGVSVRLLQSANGITDPTRLRTGQTLTIPRGHVMRKGETIYSVSRKYGVDPGVMLAANEIVDPTAVRIGQVLLIPDSDRAESERPSKQRLVQAPPPSATAARLPDGENRLWPIAGPQTRITGKLTGLKISGTEGAAVRSVSSGTVRWASPSRGFGQVVLVENPLGYIFGYLGSAETFVSVGDRVEIGTEIGRLGLNPHDQKPNLYFLVFKDGMPTDPWQAPRV